MPFRGFSHAAIIQMITQGTARLRFPPNAPPIFVASATACMAFEARERPDLRVVIGALETLLGEARMAANNAQSSSAL